MGQVSVLMAGADWRCPGSAGMETYDGAHPPEEGGEGQPSTSISWFWEGHEGTWEVPCSHEKVSGG